MDQGFVNLSNISPLNSDAELDDNELDETISVGSYDPDETLIGLS
jgi:hypothetical protein